MTRHSMNEESKLLEFEALPIQSVTLEQDYFDQAVELSDRVVTEQRQWKTYLNALALSSFQQWINEQSPDLVLDWKNCSIFHAPYANVIEVAYNLEINDFKLCLIATGGTIDSSIKLPRAVVDLSEFRAHFYVVVRVLEEQGQAHVVGFLRYDQWLTYQKSEPLHPEKDWTYRVPIKWFDLNLNHLLLHLHCLGSNTIPLMEGSTNHATKHASAELIETQNGLLRQLSHSKSIETPLWQLVTWEEGVKFLTTPLLLDWFYQLQTGQISPQVAEDPKPLLQPALDAGHWLRNELDDVAQSLGWMLLPQFVALRSPQQGLAPQSEPHPQSTIKEVDFIRKKLSREGITIPSNAGCVYKDLSLAEVPLRLYAVTWLLQDASSNSNEWTLLLIIKKQSEHSTSHTIKLSVKDQTNLLVERLLAPEAEDNYLYARVIGTIDEEFLVTIALETGVAITLPPFTMRLGDHS